MKMVARTIACVAVAFISADAIGQDTVDRLVSPFYTEAVIDTPGRRTGQIWSSNTPRAAADSRLGASVYALADAGVFKASASVPQMADVGSRIDGLTAAVFRDEVTFVSPTPGPIEITLNYAFDGLTAILGGQGRAGFGFRISAGSNTLGSTEFYREEYYDGERYLYGLSEEQYGATFGYAVNADGSRLDHYIDYGWSTSGAVEDVASCTFTVLPNVTYTFDIRFGVEARSNEFFPGASSYDFSGTAVFQGFELPGGASVASSRFGVLRSGGGVANYDAAWNEIPTPSTLIAIGAFGVIKRGRRR